MTGRVCVIFGAGERLGFSLARKYAQNGFTVIASRRSEISEEQLKTLGSNVYSIPCDVSKEDEVKALVSKVEAEHGPIHTVMYNAGVGIFKSWDTLTLQEFQSSFDINAKGLLIVAKSVCPGMIERGEGVIGITGATASLRGKPFTSAFAPSKGAQRMLAQSLARDLGQKGIHVFLAIIDGLIKLNGAEKSLDPDDIADTYWNLANQPRSAWTFEIDLRPFSENW